MKLRVLLPSVLILNLFGPFAGAATIHSDPVGDVDQSIKSACRDLSTDLVETRVEDLGSDFQVTMTVSRDLIRNVGYREYYFWIDPAPRDRSGYQPYNPDSVAWPDFYAKYRIFVSFDPNDDERTDERKVAYQDCRETDCSNDEGMVQTDAIQLSEDGRSVIFTWPKSLLPEVGKAKNWKVGFTTYYQLGACHGEDDSPQWGRPAFRISF